WAKQPVTEASPALQKLEEEGRKLTDADQTRLSFGLGDAHYRLNNLQDAERLWTRVAEAEGQENSLYVRLLLFDLALRAGDDTKMQNAVRQIRGIEGEDGALWKYGEASRLIKLAQQGDQTVLARASSLLEAVSKLRPYWSRVAVLEANIADLQGNS